MVDYEWVESWLLNYIEENNLNVQQIAYDKWNALHLAQRLESQGFTVVEIPQRIPVLTLPTKDFREKVYSRRVIHDGDPLLTWAIGNAVLKMDDQENIMISKKVSKNRIDPIASVLNAYARAMHQKKDINNHILSEDFSL